jgi:hypothetical protein
MCFHRIPHGFGQRQVAPLRLQKTHKWMPVSAPAQRRSSRLIALVSVVTLLKIGCGFVGILEPNKNPSTSASWTRNQVSPYRACPLAPGGGTSPARDSAVLRHAALMALNAKIAIAHRRERDCAEKKPYQWFTLLICVARSAYFSKAAQNSEAVSNNRSSGSRRGRGRCGAGGA